MAGLLNKFMDFIGIEETEMDDDMYGDEYYEGESQAQTDNVLNMANRSKRQRTAASAASGSNVVSLPTAASMKMIVYHPISYEDTQNIIDNLKSRKPVIVNMEELEIDCAQRILDFMAGRHLCPKRQHLQDLPGYFRGCAHQLRHHRQR